MFTYGISASLAAKFDFVDERVQFLLMETVEKFT